MTLRKIAHTTCDEGQELLKLAVRCKFITPRKEQEMLAQILAQSKKNPKTPLARFLLKNNFFSRDKIQLLFSIKNHIEILMEDRQFGKLGVVNQFVSPEKVREALEVQVKIFRKNKKSIKIGDILLQTKDISPADNTALLLTQDRIPDEFLADALYTIAKTEIEQMEIDQRFGAIAVKKEFITAGQLNTALKHQKKELKEKKPKQYLGNILKAMFKLSDADITSILKTQKKLETKRMKLEEKLTQYYVKKESKHQKLELFFKYRVSVDKLTTHVRKIKKPDKKIKLSDFLNWFSLSGIKFGLTDLKDIQAFLDRDDLEEEFKIAQGIPAQPFKEETIDFKFNTQFYDKDGSEGNDASEPPEVALNDVLAIVTPHEKARPGTDVFGRPVNLPQTPIALLSCGKGVIRKGDQFIASMPGVPRLNKNKVLGIASQVDNIPQSEDTPQLEDTPQAEDSPSTKEIKGDITSDTNDEYTSCNLRVMGNISPGVLVSCHDLLVEGEILGNLSVSGKVEVKGNIGSMPDTAKENADPVQVTVKGGIQVSGNIINAKIFAGKGLNAPKGDLISSNILSCQDIMVNNILSSPQAPSKIKITRENVFEKAEIKKMDTAIKEISEALDTLLQNDELKELTKDLMKKDQAQNKYKEKQNVLSYLTSALTDPDLEEIRDVDQKIAAFEEKSQKDEQARTGSTIPESTNAHKFMALLMGKIKDLVLKEQLSIIQEFQDSTSGMHKAAKKAREKLNKKYEIASKDIDKSVKDDSPKIDQAKQEIDTLKKKRDLLLLEQKKERAYSDPVIKVKNQVEPSTIVIGENSKLVIDKAIYGVTFKEEAETSKKKAEIIVEGYFE